MSDTRSAEAPDTARHAFRAAARAVVRDPGNTTHHLARLAAALQLPGAEPVQGALADLFRGVGPEGVAVRRAALQMAAPRLAEHIRRSFYNRVAAPVLPAVTPLATRWSVVAIPSADVSTRARRVSADDSRVLADGVLTALREGDMPAQEAFLHHCVTCQDTLAFMLARRAAHKASLPLSDAWDAVSTALEQGRGTA